MADSLGQGGEVQSQWVRVRARLRAEYGDAAYRSWLRNMSLQGIEEGRAKIAVPTRFLRDWVAAHYADRIRALWNGENNGVIAVDILVSGGTPQVVATAEPAPELSAEAGAETVDEKDVSAPLDPRFTFENFVVGKPNELAHAAARRVAEAQSALQRSVPFNPLFL
jgi:chromosomal replication initiator protein